MSTLLEGVFVVIWSNLQWKRVKIIVTAARSRDEDVSSLEDQNDGQLDAVAAKPR